jgi:tRNA (guanine-N7-)-methyltransferase
LKPKYQIPIRHPDYRYPPATNPYWTKSQNQKGFAYSDNDTEAHRGRWRDEFPQSEKPQAGSATPRESRDFSELHVEIGCNAGHVILEWATLKPEAVFIGIDWKFKAIFRAAEKGQKRGLKNVLFFRAHGERLPYMFQDAEIDHLYLFFPDPWPKKAHWKNRFITAETLRDLSKPVKEGGIFHIKTDHPDYFEWMLKAVAEVPELWEIQELSRDLHKDHPAPQKLQIPEVTLFERLFIRDRIPIQSLKLIRKFTPQKQ